MEASPQTFGGILAKHPKEKNCVQFDITEEAGINWHSFPQQSNQEKIEQLKTFHWEDEELTELEFVSSHKCGLRKRNINQSGWACDKLAGVKTCFSGITGFY